MRRSEASNYSNFSEVYEGVPERSTTARKAAKGAIFNRNGQMFEPVRWPRQKSFCDIKNKGR